MTVRQTIYDHYDTPFSYGSTDCCSFVGTCLEAAGLDNPMRFFAYDGKAEADEIIEQYGSLADAITATMGEPLPNVFDAQENDVVLVKQAGVPICGIVHQTDAGLRCVMRTTKGIIDWPLRRAKMVWRTPGG